MAAVFISYRREDSLPYARQLGEVLGEHFGAEHVFVDHGIRPGERWSDRIRAELEAADALLVLIGRAWAGPEGRRIHDPEDWVRREIETALSRDLPIVPVLVAGAKLPVEHELPASLYGLLEFQAIEVTDSRWEYDAGRVLDAVCTLLEDAPPPALDPHRLGERVGEWSIGLSGALARAAKVLDRGENILGVVAVFAEPSFDAGLLLATDRRLLFVSEFEPGHDLSFGYRSITELSVTGPMLTVAGASNFGDADGASFKRADEDDGWAGFLELVARVRPTA